MRSDKPRFRSGKSYGKKDRDGFIHRSWMKAGELPEHVFDGRPVIGNSHLRDSAEYVKRGVREAGEARAFAKANEKSYA
jgi:dihydroxy-acid dehydratase